MCRLQSCYSVILTKIFTMYVALVKHILYCHKKDYVHHGDDTNIGRNSRYQETFFFYLLKFHNVEIGENMLNIFLFNKLFLRRTVSYQTLFLKILCNLSLQTESDHGCSLLPILSNVYSPYYTSFLSWL